MFPVIWRLIFGSPLYTKYNKILNLTHPIQIYNHISQLPKKTTQDPHHGNFGLACSTNQNQGLSCSTNQNQGLTSLSNQDQGIASSATESKPRFAITPSTMAQVVSLNQNNHITQRPK